MVTLGIPTTKEARELARLANNKKIWDNLRDYFPHPYTIENAMDFINTIRADEPKHTFCIYYNNTLCGVIGLNKQLDVYSKSLEVGYWIGEPFWGKGIAREALRLITEYAFDELKIKRLHTGVYEHNLASMKVLESNGYEKEGVHRKAVYKNGQFIDEHRYAKVKKTEV